MSRLAVIGVPSSAGSYAAGQDQAPAALRAAGLIEALRGAGLDVDDAGDLPVQIWRPDRDRPYAQNVAAVTSCLVELADRLLPLVAGGDRALVLGGNCTIVLGVIAALDRLDAGRPGLLYLDRGYDINTPASTTDGALDWMGLAHGLALPGCVDQLADAFGPRPLLEPDQIAWLGVDPEMATRWEREQAAALHLAVTTSTDFVDGPAEAALGSLANLPAGPLAVHLDVDVLDFTNAPLAENTDGRNTGPSLDQAAEALVVAATDPRFRVLSIGELNPSRSAGDPGALPRFVATMTSVLASR
jgi:arginase